MEPVPGCGCAASVQAETNPTSKKAGSKSATADANGFFKIGGLPITSVNIHVLEADQFQNDVPDVKIKAHVVSASGSSPGSSPGTDARASSREEPSTSTGISSSSRMGASSSSWAGSVTIRSGAARAMTS